MEVWSRLICVTLVILCICVIHSPVLVVVGVLICTLGSAFLSVVQVVVLVPCLIIN